MAATRYIGETEKNLHRLLDRVRELAAVLSFDEADAIFGKRTTVTSSDARAAPGHRTPIDRLRGGPVVLGVTGAAVGAATVARHRARKRTR